MQVVEDKYWYIDNKPSIWVSESLEGKSKDNPKVVVEIIARKLDENDTKDRCDLFDSGGWCSWRREGEFGAANAQIFTNFNFNPS